MIRGLIRLATDWNDRVEVKLGRPLRALQRIVGAGRAALDYASLLDGDLHHRPPRTRLIAIRNGRRVMLVPVEPAIADELAGFAPSSAELTAWSVASDAHWEIAVRRGTDQTDGAEDWHDGIAGTLQDLIARQGSNADSPIWRYLVTSDGASRQPSSGTHGWRPEHATVDVRRRRLMIALGARDPMLAASLHAVEADNKPATQYPPYGEDPDLADAPTSRIVAAPRKRSVLFVNPGYYNFYYLADALRKRGWDAVSMAIVDPNSDYAKQFHGHHWNLFESDANSQLFTLRTKFKEVVERFEMLHFHGVGTLSFFPYNYDTSRIDYDRVPWDVIEMKRRGAKIAYSITGCHDLVTPSSFKAWSLDMCRKCAWRDKPDVCSDRGMAAWGWKVRQLADLICVETDPPLDFRDGPTTFREPLSFAVDPEVWHPDLARGVDVPEEWREPKAPGELLIYHSVGNFELRTINGVNVKGTGAVIRAIERLKIEGHPVRLLFRKEVPSLYNRWILAQADIIVDQLNYGRYGATAREGMMLGRPVVGRLNKTEPGGIPPVRCIAESPIVDADEETVYEALKRLVVSPEERERIGREGRAHALRWWSKDVLAERYERVYDHLRTHGRPPATLQELTVA